MTCPDTRWLNAAAASQKTRAFRARQILIIAEALARWPRFTAADLSGLNGKADLAHRVHEKHGGSWNETMADVELWSQSRQF